MLSQLYTLIALPLAPPLFTRCFVQMLHTSQNPAKYTVRIIHFSWFPIPRSKWILQPLNATFKSYYSITLTCCNLSLLLTLICFLNVSALSYMLSTQQCMQHIVAVLKSLSHARLFATQELQHTRLPCPSLCPRACSNSCPLSQGCHLTVSSSVAPFSSCPQSSPASGASNESVLLIRWPKYWSFSFNISPSNGYSGLISFRTDWFDLLAVQGTLKSLLQHHNSPW